MREEEKKSKEGNTFNLKQISPWTTHSLFASCLLVLFYFLVYLN